VTVEGHPDERARIYRRRVDGVLLVNDEQLLRDLALVCSYDPDLVILDEAQRIKNWETKTAGVVKRLEPTWRLVLTGTPMENRVEELASIMEWVDEHALEPRWRLPSWHTVRVDGGREVIGARNLDTLRQRLAPNMLRRIRSEVLAQLPPTRDLTVPSSSFALHEKTDSLGCRSQISVGSCDRCHPHYSSFDQLDEDRLVGRRTSDAGRHDERGVHSQCHDGDPADRGRAFDFVRSRLQAK